MMIQKKVLYLIFLKVEKIILKFKRNKKTKIIKYIKYINIY